MIYLNLPTNPVPASRPRVTRWATYYGKRHQACRAELCRLLDNNSLQLPAVLRGRLIIWVLFTIKKPKTTKLKIPRGDIDNYSKLLFDAMTGRIWADDIQIEIMSARKSFGDVGMYDVWIKEQNSGG